MDIFETHEVPKDGYTADVLTHIVVVLSGPEGRITLRRLQANKAATGYIVAPWRTGVAINGYNQVALGVLASDGTVQTHPKATFALPLTGDQTFAFDTKSALVGYTFSVTQHGKAVRIGLASAGHGQQSSNGKTTVTVVSKSF